MLFCQCVDDSSLCTKSLPFLYHLTKSRCHQLSRPMYKYLSVLWTELLVVRISMKDKWQSNIREIKWDFDIKIYLSAHRTFLPTMVAQCFSFPLSNSDVTVLMSAQYRLYLLLVTFKFFENILYHSVLRYVKIISCHLLIYLEIGL